WLPRIACSLGITAPALATPVCTIVAPSRSANINCFIHLPPESQSVRELIPCADDAWSTSFLRQLRWNRAPEAAPTSSEALGISPIPAHLRRFRRLARGGQEESRPQHEQQRRQEH